jgi:hypothetical protein
MKLTALLLCGCVTLTPMHREEIKVCKHLGGIPKVVTQQDVLHIHCTGIVKQLGY